MIDFHFLFRVDLAGSYSLDGDEFAAEELEDVHADIQETLEADNYEDQLPQPEVNISVISELWRTL